MIVRSRRCCLASVAIIRQLRLRLSGQSRGGLGRLFVGIVRARSSSQPTGQALDRRCNRLKSVPEFPVTGRARRHYNQRPTNKGPRSAVPSISVAASNQRPSNRQSVPAASGQRHCRKHAVNKSKVRFPERLDAPMPGSIVGVFSVDAIIMRSVPWHDRHARTRFHHDLVCDAWRWFV